MILFIYYYIYYIINSIFICIYKLEFIIRFYKMRKLILYKLVYL